MTWLGHLQLQYMLDGERTIAHDRHTGPLRVLQRLYPEGPGICHHVIVHPPGGIVGGDTLQLDATLAEGTHALLTTPGATRFYRSEAAPALQASTFTVADGARLEWLPMETIAYRGCRAENRVRLQLAPGAETIGWDLLALGLPAADQAFDHGEFLQSVEIPGTWLERGRIAADDATLLDAPLGWAGRRVLSTAWFAAGSPLGSTRRDALLDAARALCDDVANGDAADPETMVAGCTSPQPGVVVMRVLSRRVEAAMSLLAQVRGAWRREAWGLDAAPPRIWRT